MFWNHTRKNLSYTDRKSPEAVRTVTLVKLDIHLADIAKQILLHAATLSKFDCLVGCLKLQNHGGTLLYKDRNSDY